MNLCKTIDGEGVTLGARHQPPVWMQRANRACFGISTVLALFCFSFPWLTPSVLDSVRGPIHITRTFLPSTDPYFESDEDWWTSAPWPGYSIPAEFWILAGGLTALVTYTIWAQRRRPFYEPAILVGLSLVVLSNFAGVMGAQSLRLFLHSEFARHIGYDLCLGLGIAGCLSILFGLLRIAWSKERFGSILGLCALLISLHCMWAVHGLLAAPNIAQVITRFVVQDLPVTPIQDVAWYNHRYDLWHWRIEIQGDADVSRTFINGVELDEAELEACIAGASEDDSHSAIIRASGSLNMSEIFAVTDLLVATGAQGVRFETCVRPGIAVGAFPIYLIDPEYPYAESSRIELRGMNTRDGVSISLPEEWLHHPEVLLVTVAVEPSTPWQTVASVLDQLTLVGADSTLEQLRQ